MIGVEVVELDPPSWNKVATNTLKYSFGCDWPEEKGRVSKAYITQDESTKVPYGFMTLVEFDSESVYMQHGGNFPTSKGFLTLKTYQAMVDRARKQYKYISTRICNRNTPMIKLALHVGFLITGTQLDPHGDLYLVLEMRGLL